MSAMLYLTSPRRLSGKAAQAERTPFKRVSSISMPAWITHQARAKPIPLNGHLESLKANTETCGDADDVFFDAKRRRIYVSCGEGLVDVLQGDAAGYHALAHIPTRSGARTSLFVPELDRLFVAARAGLLGSDAALLVFRPGP